MKGSGFVASSLTMRPQRVSVSGLQVPREEQPPFERYCMQPGTRCNDIMQAILAGEDYGRIGARHHTSKHTIMVYALVLARHGYLVDVIDTAYEVEHEDKERMLPARFAAITPEMVEEVKKLRGKAYRIDIAKHVGITLELLDEVIYYIKHGHFRGFEDVKE